MKRILLLIFCFQYCIAGATHSVKTGTVYKDSTMTIPVEQVKPNKVYWTQINVNDITIGNPDYLEFDNLGEVRMYRKGQLVGKSGKLLPMSEKSYDSFRNLIPVYEEGKYEVRIETSHPLINQGDILISFWTLKELRQQENQRLLAQGFFFGLIIVMSLYNLMIYFSVKDQSYLYYVFSILGLGLYLFFFYGFSIEILWPEYPRWDAYFFALVVPLTNIARILFTRTYLHTWEYTPRWDRFFVILIALYSIPLFFWLASYLGWSWGSLPLNYIIGTLGTIVLVSITLVSILVYLKGYTPALWFMVAYLLFNVGGILFIFRELGYLPDNFFTRYLLQFGAAAQVILFSLGLADRLNRTRQKLAAEILEKERIAREKEIEKNRKVIIQKEELEQKVRERTSELETLLRQITDSESKLRELNHVKDRLFSIISHDLKNPLTTVDSFLTLLMQHYDKLSKEDLTALSQQTKFALQNLTILLDNLLHWSRMQQNYITFNPQVIKMQHVFSKVQKLFRLLLDEKHIAVEIDDSSRAGLAFGDRDMFEFVVRNLVHNAIKFTPKGGRITISVVDKGDFLKLEVKDSGLGMKQRDIDRILTLGESFTKTGTEKEKGSGIGLLMCKEFIERNGGQMTIYTPGQGTSVNFEIPSYKTTSSIA